MIVELEKGFSISSDRSKLDLKMIHDFLSRRSYWAQNIPLSVVQKSIDNSLCFGVYLGDKQVGFARVITDSATFAYFSDVFILEDYRGYGLGKQLIQAIRKHPELQNLRRWLLATKDAHDFYEKYDFRALGNPEMYMEIHDPKIYQSI